MKEVWHGTHNGYTTHGCRCTRCREAERVYKRAYRKTVGGVKERAYSKSWKHGEDAKIRASQKRFGIVPLTTPPFYLFLGECSDEVRSNG